MADVVESRAHVRHVRIAPRKVRIVVDLIRGKSIRDAEAILRHTPKRASVIVAKVLKSAVANAQHNYDMDPQDLYVHAVWVDGGPTLKRIHPRSRGQAFSIFKRTSHISVVLRPRQNN
ncbi:MAG: 50S ribosomal protein L22 [Firmicutes bacterium]|jgi:large subunit ribosomal protein L22|nr:50S ribosomal protein L22 [Bacillota bacterium]MCL5014668.1 50S ribosomal protein L22 [Bacillota bacterium]